MRDFLHSYVQDQQQERHHAFAVLFAKAADTIGGGTSWEERNFTLIVHFMDGLSG